MDNKTFFAEIEEALNQRKEITLYQPSAASVEYVSYKLNTMSATTLKKWANALLPLIRNNKFKVDGVDKRTSYDLLERFAISDKGKVKSEVVMFISFFVADSRNFKHYLNTLSPSLKELWEEACKRIYIDAILYKEVTNKPLYKEERWHIYLSEDSVSVPPFFKVERVKSDTIGYGYRSDTYCIYIHPAVADVAAVYFVGNGRKELCAYETLPQDEQLTCMTGTDREFAEKIEVLQSLAAQGILQLNSSGKLLVTTKKKVTQQVVLKEFFTDPPYAEQATLHSTFLLFAVADYNVSNYEANGLDYWELCKSMYDVVINNLFDIHQMLMLHIGGLNVTASYDAESSVKAIAMELKILSRSMNGWTSVNNILDVLCTVFCGKKTLTFVGLDDFNYKSIKNKLTDSYVRVSNLHDEIFIPYVKSMLFFMASIGLLDVAYSKPSKSDKSYVDCLRYVRLTDLGAYVLGKTKSYKPIEVEKKVYFELDENNLILKSMESDNPYIGIVESIARGIGGGRYIITPESFLKSCATEKDVEDKVKLFKQFVSENITPVWEDFFKSVKAKCKPLTPISREKYKIFKISPNNKELLHILSSDEKLRKLIVRAEGYMVMIDKNNIDNVVSRLKTFGYLI